MQWCGADRLGHGVRIIDDIAVADDGTAKLGLLASYVRDMRIPLEMCPSSNLQTGAAASIAEHPIGLLADLRFRVTVNTDNRLMSSTSMTREHQLLCEAFGWGLDKVEWLTVNAMKSAFLPYDERYRLIMDDHQALVPRPPADLHDRPEVGPAGDADPVLDASGSLGTVTSGAAGGVEQPGTAVASPVAANARTTWRGSQRLPR